MVRILFSLDHHIINVRVHGFTHHRLENLGDHSFVCGSNVFQPEGHDIVTTYAVEGDEGSFLLVRLMHGYLMVNSICIQELIRARPDVKSTS